MPDPNRRVLLAKPRGYCAGVDRAVQTVELALERFGAPVYVRKQIVHNTHVVRSLEERGAIFVEETAEVPEGSVVVFSAHGVAPQVHQDASDRNLRTIDATCPLVTKVHNEARRFAAQDYDILLIGHEGHEEVVGTTGEAPARIHLVDGPGGSDSVQVRDPARVAWLSQTTLSVDETNETVAALRTRFPQLLDPPSDDICYATQNRQAAVKQIAPGSDVESTIEVVEHFEKRHEHRLPAALDRRMRAGPGAETRTVQKIVSAVAFASAAAVIVLSVLDHRFGWSQVPPVVSVVGDALVAIGLGVAMLAVIQNSYAAANITVEGNQHVVSTGLYRLVRHPMYVGNLIMMAGIPLALGSYWGLAVVIPGLLVLVIRVLDEEKLLAQELAGYREYTQKVRYRLVPYVW